MELQCPKCKVRREVSDIGLREFCQCSECRTIFPREPLPQGNVLGCTLGCLGIILLPVFFLIVIGIIVALTR